MHRVKSNNHERSLNCEECYAHFHNYSRNRRLKHVISRDFHISNTFVGTYNVKRKVTVKRGSLKLWFSLMIFCKKCHVRDETRNEEFGIRFRARLKTRVRNAQSIVDRVSKRE